MLDWPDYYLEKGGNMLECPNCGSHEVREEVVTEQFPYGQTDNAFTATFPVLKCYSAGCGFGWRDWRSEEIIDKAQAEYEQKSGPGGRS